MKIRLLLILTGLVIGFAVTVHTQEPNTVDGEVRQQIEGLINKHANAVNKKDMAAIAALYTQYAAEIRSWELEGGLVSGPQAIEKRFADEIAIGPGEYLDKLFRCIPSVTKYLLSRNGVGGQGPVTVQGFLFVTPRAIAGRSVWNTSCCGINLDSIAKPLAIASNSDVPTLV